MKLAWFALVLIVCIALSLTVKAIKEVNEPNPSTFPPDRVSKFVKHVTGEEPVVLKVLYVNLDNDTYIFEGDSQPGAEAKAPYVVWDGKNQRGFHVTAVGKNVGFMKMQWERMGLVLR